MANEKTVSRYNVLQKATGIVLSAALLSSGFIGLLPQLTTSSSLETEAASNNYGLVDNIQDGVILHCFCWKYNDIKAMLPEIAESGFTSIQVSPPQATGGTGSWWWVYQPLGFYIGTNALGTKDDLKSLCEEADKYGIKIIADIVANHLAGDHSNIQDDLKDSQYWHPDIGASQDGNRYQVTHGTIGMPDLNTEHSYVQQCVAKYVQELKSVGVDGIRWDAAKHIGLPSEGDNFWPSVTADSDLWNYGEILNNPGVTDEPQATNILKEYTNYMSVTDSTYGMTLRNAFNSGTAPSAYGNLCAKGLANNKLVYWGESHDTWSNNKDWGYSNDMSQNVIDRAYAVAASRNDVTALYFSRPSSKIKDDIKLGEKGSTHFTSKEVAEVNKFHNAMVGKADYYTTSNNCSVITRKDGGAVIVAGSGSNFEVSVTNAGGYCPAGTYTDPISGNTWTVTSSTISGKIGDSGIAVIYDAGAVITGAKVSATPGTSTFTDSVSVTLNVSGATSGSYTTSEGASGTFTNGQKITLGSSTAVGGKVTLTLTATGEDGKAVTETYTYTKKDPAAVTTLYFDNSSYNWSSVYAYIYTGDGTTAKEAAAWPGTAMTKDSATGYYKLEVPSGFESGRVIFTESKDATTNRYPADQKPGLEIGGSSKIFSKGNSWEDYSVTPPVSDPTVTSSVASGSSFSTETTSITLTLANAVSGTYTVDDGPVKSFTSSAKVTIGEGKIGDSTVTVKATATGSDGTTKTYTFTYEKKYVKVTSTTSATNAAIASAVAASSSSLSSYYSTNATGKGANKTITVDGSVSDWDSSMLIAQAAANDDPRVYRPNSMYEIPYDAYALYGAWDDTNLYLMIEMTNVQDVVAPNDNYP
ncbi:MAG: starch-binding protein, partial [Acutalibacteraceae bacterium]